MPRSNTTRSERESCITTCSAGTAASSPSCTVVSSTSRMQISGSVTIRAAPWEPRNGSFSASAPSTSASAGSSISAQNIRPRR